MNNTPPEILEQWLAEFDNKYFTMSTVKLDKKTGKYRPRLDCENNAAAEKECIMMNNWLDVWIASRQSVCIELPEYHDSQFGGFDSGKAAMRTECVEAIESQGYKCRMKVQSNA